MERPKLTNGNEYKGIIDLVFIGVKPLITGLVTPHNEAFLCVLA